jgi:hypothetical protein
MKNKNIDPYFEIKLLPKLLKIINTNFPNLEDKAAVIFNKELKKYNKNIDDENIIFLLFIQWFLLKYKIGNYFSLISFLSINQNMEFNPAEIEAIRNMRESRQSIFEIIKISKNKKIILLKDLLNKYLIKVILPKPFKKDPHKDIILAVVAKRLDEDYYDEKEIPLLKKNFFGGKK